MSRVKKISTKQFTLDVINKARELAGASIFDSMDVLKTYAELHPQWFEEISFTSVDQYNAWRDYFYNHFYDWQPKRISKILMKKEFDSFSLNYGPRYKFDYKEIK